MPQAPSPTFPDALVKEKLSKLPNLDLYSVLCTSWSVLKGLWTFNLSRRPLFDHRSWRTLHYMAQEALGSILKRQPELQQAQLGSGSSQSPSSWCWGIPSIIAVEASGWKWSSGGYHTLMRCFCAVCYCAVSAEVSTDGLWEAWAGHMCSAKTMIPRGIQSWCSWQSA